MDFLLAGLHSKFERTTVPLSRPLVLHAVAGAGKSTFLRSILTTRPETRVITYGTPDPPSLSGLRITGPLADAEVIDEYPGQTHPDALLVACDPLQHRNPVLPAHFIATHSFRFGRQTCELLATFGITATSDHDDQVVNAGVFSTEPIGTIIALDAAAADLLTRHSAEFLTPCQALGLTFCEVTVVSDCPLTEADPVDRYIAVTRHTSRLLVLT